MPRVTRRPLAAADILDIWDHIAEDSLGQADRWIDKLDEKLRLIATQPLMGRAREELAPICAAFRSGGTSSSTPRSTFEEAQSAFFDELAVQFFDGERSAEEERFLMLGMSSEARLLLVCHCERRAGSVIRIISARRATKRESTFCGGDGT